MKILHVLSTPRAEGTPNLVLDWLAAEQHEQDVFVLNNHPTDLTDRLRSEAKWYGEKNYFGRGRRKFTDIAWGVRRVCKQRQPDVLVCWPTGFANWVCLGARLAGVRRLLVHCGNPPNRGFKADWMSRYGFWPIEFLGAKCVCCSEYVRDRYRSIPLVRKTLFQTVYNCARAEDVAQRAQMERVRRGGQRGKIAIMVATLEKHKDHATLLKAVPLVRIMEPSFKLWLVGDGSLRQELVELAGQIEIGDAVEFLGSRRDVPELLGRADLFVLSTTHQEGLGSVLLEALAAGLPVIASDVPACRELLAGGRYGKLVPPQNPAALAEVILALLSSKVATSAELAAYARSFTPQRMIGEYLRL
jgi:glycosyltransferase involved in cell wall biosynthesis